MTVREFIDTLYYGDRACKSIAIDGWERTVRFQVNKLSRVRSESGNWEFYDEEDIDDAYIVFGGLKSFAIQNAGFIPNDLINSIEVVEESGSSSSIVELSIDAVASDATRIETIVRIECDSVHLEDPAHPGTRITT